jgi:toxin ParE1/3/4
MRFRVARKAQHDLDEIFLYWASRAGVDVADRLMDDLEERFALLSDFPNIGRECGEFRPGARSFPAGNYLIYYRKGRTAIEILHVFHGERDQHRAFRRMGPA